MTSAITSAFTSKPSKSGNNNNNNNNGSIVNVVGVSNSNSNNNNNDISNNKSKFSRKKSIKNGKTSKMKSKYSSYTQEEEGSLIFHQLDPSQFPLTKLDISQWMLSSSTDQCSICLLKIDSKLFGTKKRHCKKCGRVVCIPCSDIRIRKHRLCIQCNRYYLSLNNILNLWYRTNRNINHSLCGYDTYTLDCCASLKRILFILNHYHQWLLLKKPDLNMDNITSNGNTNGSNTSGVHVAPPFDISSITMKQFVNRLPKYEQEIFLNDIHHLKNMHFKNKQIFKISQYQKNHQWELRAYSWKKIGKCNRYGCQYGIKDIRNSNTNSNTNDDDNKVQSTTSTNHKRNPSVNLNSDIPTLLNNMHVILLHGIDDDVDDQNARAKELYDLLPQTPMSPHMGGFFTPNKKSKAPVTDPPALDIVADGNVDDDDDDVDNVDNVDVMTDSQRAIIELDISPLSSIEWMDSRNSTLCIWLSLCSYKCNFYSSSPYEWEVIQKKKVLLSDILDYLDVCSGSTATGDIWSNEMILKSILLMITSNIFRSLPLTFRQVLLTPDYCLEDDNDEYEDASYPHLCYIYEITLMFIRNINLDDKLRKKYLGKSFIIPLTELFASEDIREREYLKAILHGIYARNMRLRRLIRSQMSNNCYRIIYNTINNDNIENGISECLQLICSIIQGLTQPIKPEYCDILYNVLIPLHKCNNRKLNKYHETLLACCIQFILKDINISIDILNGLIKYWPYQSANKSDMFLKEIVIIINTIMSTSSGTILMNKYPSLQFKIINKLCECIISQNHCLSEKSLLAFGEVGIQKLCDLMPNKIQNWKKILNILFDNKNNKRHWCKPLNDSFNEALDTFIIRDEKYVKSFKPTNSINYFTKNIIYYGTLSNKNKINKIRKNKWKQIHIMAEQNKNKNKQTTQLQPIKTIKPKPPKPVPKKPTKPQPIKPLKPLPIKNNDNFV